MPYRTGRIEAYEQLRHVATWYDVIGVVLEVPAGSLTPAARRYLADQLYDRRVELTDSRGKILVTLTVTGERLHERRIIAGESDTLDTSTVRDPDTALATRVAEHIRAGLTVESEWSQGQPTMIDDTRYSP